MTIPTVDDVAHAIHDHYAPLSAIPWDSLRDHTREALRDAAIAAMQATLAPVVGALEEVLDD